MNKTIFGTDGIRSLAKDKIFNTQSLDILSQAILKKKNFTVVIGRDTRESSKMIENTFSKSLKKNGAKVFKVGLLPTPAISYLTKKLKCHLGIVISASHNPYQYNGIKFFNKNGEKLSDLEEKKIENNFYKINKKNIKKIKKGEIKILRDSLRLYKKKIFNIIKTCKFKKKLKIIVDCANGASYKAAKYLFSDIKMNFVYIKDKPNGKNINYKCGTLYPQNLIKKVKQTSANFGISFDGDADRVICCDEKGKIIDGDKILACLSEYFSNKNKLNINAVVGTLMSNRGLELFVRNLGLKFYRAKVGDKFVYKLMKEKRCFLGGEQSGHIIINKFGPTGDGILIAAYLIKIIAENDKDPSKIFNLYRPHLQIQKNIKYKDSKKQKNRKISSLLKNYNNKIINHSRVLIRFSGTEPVVRLLVEGVKYSVIKHLANILEKKIRKSL